MEKIKGVLKNILDTVVNESELKSDTRRALSLLFLLLSFTMSLGKYSEQDVPIFSFLPFLDFINKDLVLEFKPSFVSTIFALLLVSPLYLRGILKWTHSAYSIISFILILFVFSSFVELAAGGERRSDWVFALLCTAVALSWLGMTLVAGMSWALALLAAILSVKNHNIAMGFSGAIYICFGALGLFLHTGLNPGEFLQSIREEYSPATDRIRESAEDTLKASGERFEKK